MKEDKVLSLIKEGLVFSLPPTVFHNRKMTIAEMEAIFKFFGAFWQYQGLPQPKKPHAKLSSRLHSNGFVFCKEVLKHPSVCPLFANEMLKVITEKLSTKRKKKIDVVVSSAYSAINLGWEVARLIARYHNEKVEYIPVEKDKNGRPTIIRGGIDPEKNVLIVNEVMTTGEGSTWETVKAVLTCNGKNPAPRIIKPAFVLVHRSKDWTLINGLRVQPVFHLNMEDFGLKDCPYCKAGSEAIEPKIGDGTNWKRLHGLA